MEKRRYEKVCGIYKITNLINGKCYIGQSVDIYERWHQHKYADYKESVIHTAIKKYGIENFSFEIIEKIHQAELNEREIYWINYYDSYNNGYNCTTGGDTGIKYDYAYIYELWNNGLNNKEICEQLKCNDKVVTRALRSYDISEEEVRSRSNFFQKRPIVAIDIVSKKPLKIFNSIREAAMYFDKNLLDVGSILECLKNRRNRSHGYCWEYLTDDNQPSEKLSDEIFLSYRQNKLFILSEEQKNYLSKINRKVERCNRETLKSLIRSTPFTRIAEQFGVSDNAIRKWCDYYNLPRRVKDIKLYSDEEWANI